MNSQPSREILLQEARRRGLIQKEASMMPDLSDLLKSSLAGSIKGIEQTGVNILNTPAALSNKLLGTQFQGMQVPESIDPTKQWQLSQNPFARAAEALPQLGMPVIANQLLQRYGLGKMPPTASLPSRAAVAGGIGYATGPGMEKGKEAFALGSAAMPLIGGITEKGIGRKVTAISRQRHQEYSNRYNQLLNQIEDLPGSQRLRVPSSLQSEDVNRFLEGLSPKYNKSLRRFINNPTFRNAHDAQSDIKIGSMALKNKRESGVNLTKQEQFADQRSRDYTKRIQGEMMRFLTEKNAPQFAKEYSNLTKGYAKEVAPFKFKEVEKARIGRQRISPAKVGRSALNRQELEESQISKQIPGYLMRQRLEPAMPLIKKGLSIAGAGTILSQSPYIPSYLTSLIKGIYGG